MSRLERLHKEREELARKAFRNTLTILLKIVIGLIIVGAMGIIIVFHSPFTYLKELWVTTAMTTMNHQYLARWFVSEEEINRIMAKNNINDTTANTDESKINANSHYSKEIKMIELKGKTYKGHLLIVSDPSRVTIGAASNFSNRGMKVKDLAEKYGAVAAINAGGFVDENGHGTGAEPDGLLIENYKILHDDHLSTYRLIGFDKNNVLVVGTYTLKEIKDMNIRDAVSFRPFLIINGEPTIKSGNGGWGFGPRTAIGQRKDGTILMIVIDGRQISSVGATMKDVQDIMLQYGAVNAANLDGGSSTTLVYQGKLINNPCSRYGPRYVPSVFIVKP